MDDSNKEAKIVCFTINEDFVRHVCVAISSLLKNNPSSFFEIYVFHQGLDLIVQKRILDYYSPQNAKIKFKSTDSLLVSSFKVSGHAASVNYLRIYLAELLVEYSKVLYLDADLVIHSDISEIFDMDIKNYSLAAVACPNVDRSEVLEIPHENYFNSGVMLLNLTYWRDNNIVEKVEGFLRENPSKIHYWDQDALNAILHMNYLRLESKWNYIETSLSPQELSITDLKIIHFVGEHKPWNYFCQHPLKDQYFRYLRETPWPNFVFPEKKWSYKINKLFVRIWEK